MKADQVQPRAGNEGRQPLHEFQRRHHQVRRAVAPRRLLLQYHPAGGVAMHPLVGQRRTRDVAAKSLQPLAVVGFAAHRCVQAETLHLRAKLTFEARVARHGALNRQQLLAGARAEGDPIGTRGRLQRPQRARVVRVVVGHVHRVLLLDQRAVASEHLQDAADHSVAAPLGHPRRSAAALRRRPGRPRRADRHRPAPGSAGGHSSWLPTRSAGSRSRHRCRPGPASIRSARAGIGSAPDARLAEPASTASAGRPAAVEWGSAAPAPTGVPVRVGVPGGPDGAIAPPTAHSYSFGASGSSRSGEARLFGSASICVVRSSITPVYTGPWVEGGRETRGGRTGACAAAAGASAGARSSETAGGRSARACPCRPLRGRA